MRILITGNMGYVGPVVVAHLRAVMPQAELIGYDAGFFAADLTDATAWPERLLDRQEYGDIRDVPARLLAGVDAVVHLAAISNDPMGHRFEDATIAINQRASIRLAELASEAGVASFVFASSCSVYGSAEEDCRREEDPLDPLTAYARSKVGTEQALATLARRSDMTLTCLRFATACGISPRLRLDLVLNDFVAAALLDGQIRVMSDGSPWRPLIDVADMARAIEWAITRDVANGGQFLAVNAGRDEGNVQIAAIAERVAEQVAHTGISINDRAPPDKRSYRVDFSRYRTLAPNHQPQVDLEQSIDRLLRGLLQSVEGGDGRVRDMAVRLRSLETHINAGRLDHDLRWVSVGRQIGTPALARVASR